MQYSILLGLGLVLAWVGERIIEAPSARLVVTGAGTVLLLFAASSRALYSGRQHGELRRVQRLFSAFAFLALFAFALYALQSDLFAKATGSPLSAQWPKLSGILSALWPALMALSLLPTLLMELSFSTMAKAPKLEDGRILEAMLSGVGLASAFIFAFAMQYVATERDSKVDFSYFRVAKAGEATKKLVASLDAPFEVYLFFPPASDVAEAVVGYFKELESVSNQLNVNRLDHALEPLKAKDMGISGNGTIVFKKGARKETMYIGTEIEKARTQLRGLDGEVQKRLLQVAQARRTIYFTGGHGERSQEPTNEMDQRSTIEILSKTLKDQNFEVRTLTTAEGLGQEVPKDAAAIFIIGPSSPFSEPEAKAIETYAQNKGRLFIALDPENGLRFDELLKPFGLTFTAQAVAQERGTANVRPPPGLADRINIGIRTFSSHPTVTHLGRSNVPVLMLGAGGLDELPSHAADLNIDFAVRSLPDSWNDANGNFEFDSNGSETKKAWGVVAAVERRSASNKTEEAMRALILGDSDAVADLVLNQLPGNQYLVVDGFKWLLGDEHLSGTTNTEVDVPLARSRQQDTVWFYGTTFLAPVAVLGIGFLARRRAKKITPIRKETQS